MCELLGMSANVPTDICFSFTGLIQRGGATAKNSDGWGIAFYEDRGCRSFHDTTSSVQSEIAGFVRRYPIKSTTVVSHVRKRNRGRVCLANTHPFIRELWGRYWVFAHNGQVKGIKKTALAYFRPVGTTDSEYAFCWLLDQLRQAFPQRPKNQRAFSRFLYARLLELNDRGVFNMLLSDGKFLYALCSTHLYWIKRHAPFGNAKLVDLDLCIDFQQETSPQDIVSIIATTPLTGNETWNAMQAGELLVFKDGVARSKNN